MILVNDFKILMDFVIKLLSIKIPVFGHYISFLSIFLSLAILSIVIGFVVKIFGGDD